MKRPWRQSSHFFCRRCLFTMASLYIGACDPSGAPADDEPLPTLEECRTHLNETLSSFSSIRLTLTHRQLPKSDGPVNWEVEGVTASEDVWTWSLDGRKRAMEQTPRLIPPSNHWLHGHRAYDGARSYLAVYDNDDAARMETLNIHTEVDPLLYFFKPDLWLGLHLPWTNSPLAKVLENSPARIAGWDPIEGEPCVYIRFNETGNLGEGITLQALWLDPAHDWLPRRFLVSSDGEGQAEKFVQTYWVSTYGPVKDGTRGEERWFPLACLMESVLTRHEVDVRDVSINERLRADLFRIEPQSGTRVIETRYEGGREVVTHRVHGGRAAIAARHQQIVEEARKMASGTGDLADATPEPRRFPAAYGWLLSLLCAIAALFVWWRHR